MSEMLNSDVLHHLHFIKSKATERHFDDKFVELIKPDDESANSSILISDTDEKTVSYLPEEIDAYGFQSKLDSRAEELAEILGDCTPAEAEELLLEYVRNNIDPGGWLAIWVSSKFWNPDGVMRQSNDKCHLYLVQVKEVFMNSLEADVVIYQSLHEALNSFEKSFVEEQIFYTANLLELWPLKSQPNYTLTIKITHNILELLRLFYKYIWRPYDNENAHGAYMEDHVMPRMQLLQDAANKSASQTELNSMTRLIRESLDTVIKIHNLEDEYDVMNPDSEISEIEACRLAQLHEKQGKVKEALDFLESPMLRVITKRKDSKEDLVAHIVSEKSSLQNMMKILDDIHSKIGRNVNVVFHPNINDALVNASTRDFVFLQSGQHEVSTLGNLESGGFLVGLSQYPGDVVLKPSGSGDILLCCESCENLQLENLVIVGTTSCSLVLHVDRGHVEMINCSIIGAKHAVKMGSSSTINLVSTTIKDCKTGITLADDSCLTMNNSTIRDCTTGLQLCEDTKGRITSSNISGNEVGIGVMTTDLKLNVAITKDSLSELCPNIITSDCKFSENKCDLVTTPLM